MGSAKGALPVTGFSGSIAARAETCSPAAETCPCRRGSMDPEVGHEQARPWAECSPALISLVAQNVCDAWWGLGSNSTALRDLLALHSAISAEEGCV